MCSHNYYCNRQQNQRGVSLIELMVGITIGLLVVIGAIGSLVFSQTTTTVLADTARVQQKADAVFSNLAYHLLQAGAINIEDNGTSVSFSQGYTGIDAAISGIPNQILFVYGTEGTNNAPDTLTVSYQDNLLPRANPSDPRPSEGIRDCLGNPPVNEFNNIFNQFSLDNTTQRLMCRGSSGQSGATAISNTTGSSPETAAIAEGIEDFQVWYGLDSTDASGNTLFTYYTADTVPAQNWEDIKSVRICIVILGDTKNKSDANSRMQGCTKEIDKITSDGRFRRVYWRTIGLRNSFHETN